MDAKKILAELLNRGCIREGREMTAFQLIKFEIEANAAPSQPSPVAYDIAIPENQPISAEDLDAVADEAKAKEDTKGTVN